jgi:transketolase
MMQRAYINTMYQLMSENPDVVLLMADSGTAYDTMLMNDFPDQYVNVGIAEENLIGMAAGMAAGGKIPFVFSNGAFLAYRGFEFIRDDICLQKNNVKLIGMGSGLSISSLGPSHHTTEDIGVLRTLPGLIVLSPATPKELAAVIKYAYQRDGAFYIRMEMGGEIEFHKEAEFKFTGKNVKLLSGGDICIFCTGSILKEVHQAAEQIKKHGHDVTVVNVMALKPFDKGCVEEYAKQYKKFLSVEEHNIYGGLGSILAEVVAEKRLDVELKVMGLKDRFASGYGTVAQLRRMNNLDAEAIEKQVMEMIGDE